MRSLLFVCVGASIARPAVECFVHTSAIGEFALPTVWTANGRPYSVRKITPYLAVGGILLS